MLDHTVFCDTPDSSRTPPAFGTTGCLSNGAVSTQRCHAKPPMHTRSSVYCLTSYRAWWWVSHLEGDGALLHTAFRSFTELDMNIGATLQNEIAIHSFQRRIDAAATSTAVAVGAGARNVRERD